MKAEFISSTLKPGAAEFTIRKMLFVAQVGEKRYEFELMAPFDQQGRGLAEGLKFKDGWPVEASSIALKLIIGTTTVIKTWIIQDAIQDEYVLDFCLDLHLKTKDGRPTFEVELEITY